MGIVSPVGSKIEKALDNIREGNSGIGLVDNFDKIGRAHV
jgi:3-oxoacyl-(acyl-carrier-protein) synthase